jgi:histidine triad (HIT) family protein
MTEMTEEQRKEMEEKIKNMSPEELKEFQKKQCIFCQIISGKIPSKKIYEDEKAIAILDINPAAKGHVLVMPKEHYAIMPQMPDKEVAHLFKIAKKISQIILKGLKVSGTNLFVANGLAAGQRAQHFIIHVIPRKDGDNLLKVEEKLVDTEMRKKVKMLVENEFNKLMGIKKKIIEIEDSKESEEVVKKQPKIKKKKEEVIEETGVTEKQDEPGEEEKEDTEESEEDESPKKDDGDASLDDIANLFK